MNKNKVKNKQQKQIEYLLLISKEQNFNFKSNCKYIKVR